MKKLVLALAAVALIATPALADYSFYGSARTAVFYLSDDTTGTDVKTLNLQLQGNSRLGLKATTGDVAGRIEIGARNSTGNVYTRLLYGEVKLGQGTLLVGQSYNNYTKFSNQVLNDDLGFIGFGALYDGRQPQIKYTMDNGFYLAAIRNTQAGADDLIPKLNAGYNGKAGNFTYNVGVGYQSYEDAVSGDKVNSYLLYLCGDAKAGEATIIYAVHYGQNIGDYGISGRSASADWNGGDSKGYGGMLEVDMAGFAAGVGYVNDEADGAAESDSQIAYFVNYTFNVAKGFKIVPEFAMLDYLDDETGADEGRVYGVGAKFQMDF